MTCGSENDPYCELALDLQRNAGARHTCRLCHAHYKDCIILLLFNIE